MRNIKVVLEYDGTNYSGFQIQANAKTIQNEIEKAIKVLTGENLRVTASGRTDAGVHARGQVINFKTESRIPEDRFVPALNSVLPPDIRARESCEVSEDFHARYSVVEKTYKYIILNRNAPSALLRNLTCWVGEPLDFDLMHETAGSLLGTHDFSAFMSSGSSVKTTVRIVSEAVVEKKDDFHIFMITANGFLYNMVRIITGTLIEVGKGRLPSGILKTMIETGDRSLGGPTAPACGLYLFNVRY